MRLLYIQCIQPNGLDFFFKERSFGNEDRAVSSDPNPLEKGLSLYQMSTVNSLGAQIEQLAMVCCLPVSQGVVYSCTDCHGS